MFYLKPDRLVFIWFSLVCVLLVAMILFGGAVRLTNSGLSITEWEVIKGIFPPITKAQWNAAFESYKAIPEYLEEHAWMNLDDFKFIYWMEWGHRFLGRLIGLFVFIPLIIFICLKWIHKPLFYGLFLLLILGVLQGGIGWWMVSSGLSERVDVSQYRLVVHLTMAFLILGGVFWLTLTQFDRSQNRNQSEHKVKTKLIFLANMLVFLVFVQIALGGFVAGLRAGWSYPSWPLMGESFIPEGYLKLASFWKNSFEHHGYVQFHHRMMAYFLFLLIPGMFFYFRKQLSSIQKTWYIGLILILFIQLSIGIATLFSDPELWGMALLHQAIAILLFLTCLGFRHRLTHNIVLNS